MEIIHYPKYHFRGVRADGSTVMMSPYDDVWPPFIFKDLLVKNRDILGTVVWDGPFFGTGEPVADPNEQLMVATSLEKAIAAVAAGADPNCVGADGWRPLHHACLFGRTKVVCFLLNCRAVVNVSTTEQGLTPLHMAVASGSLPIVDLLVSSGAWVNAKTRSNQTPLGMASGEIADYLRKRGAY